MNRITLTTMAILCSLAWLPPTTALGGDPCVSYIYTVENHRCVVYPVRCDSTFCDSPGTCHHCSAHELQGLCEPKDGARCAKLEDCDGCGEYVWADCQFLNGVWVCVPTTYSGVDCMRDWCSGA